MMQKTKVVILVACLALILIGTMSTLAYFTDQEKATNTFTVGKVYIDLDEQDVDDSDKDGDTTDRDKQNEYHLLPGHPYIKDPTVHVFPDSNDCYVYVTVDNQIAEIESNDAGYKSIAAQMADNWVLLEDENGQPVKKDNKQVYVYKNVVTKNETESTDLQVFANFKIDGEDVTKEDLALYEDARIIVNAYAVQAEGFETAFKAWDAAKGEF